MKKKTRKNIKAAHEREARLIKLVGAREAQSLNRFEKELILFIEDLKGYSAIFPNIVSEPIKLGTWLKATVQIGNDLPQPDCLLFVSIAIGHAFYTEENLKDLRGLVIDRKKQVIVARQLKSGLLANVVLKIMAPSPEIGYRFTPVYDFSWYGKEIVSISEIREAPVHNQIVAAPFYQREHITPVGWIDKRRFLNRENLDKIFNQKQNQ